MIQPGIRPSSVSQGAEQGLGNDWPGLPGGSAYPMTCWAIPCREHLTRNNESRRVGSEVLEKVAETIKGKQSTGGDSVKSEANNAKEDCKHYKWTDLNWFPPNSVDRRNRHPIPRDQSSGR